MIPTGRDGCTISFFCHAKTTAAIQKVADSMRMPRIFCTFAVIKNAAKWRLSSNEYYKMVKSYRPRF